MKPYQKHQRELVRTARELVKKHGNVRDAAKAFGMSRSGFHGFCRANGIAFPTVRASRRDLDLPCVNCGKTWGQHFGRFCRPSMRGSEWVPQRTEARREA